MSRSAARLAVAAAVLALLPSAARSQAYTLDRIGESQSGGQFTALNCPSGSVIVGLEITAGTYVDGVGLKCARPLGRNLLGTPFDGLSAVGDNPLRSALLGVRSRTQVFFCPPHYVLRGLAAYGGEWVDRVMSMRCVRYRGTETESVRVEMGGDGGSLFLSACRGADAVFRIEVQTGAWLNYLRMRCAAQ